MKSSSSIFGPGPKYPPLKSFAYILLSTLICTPLVCWLYLPHLSLKPSRSFPIKNLFLVCPKTSDLLPPVFFSEILGLYADSPTLLKHFSTQRAEATLISTNLFEYLYIDKAPDNKGIVISYSLTQPIAYLGNFSNILFDAKGKCFPCQPFHSPKKLPKIFFAPSDLPQSLTQNISSSQLQLAKEIFSSLEEFQISVIDLSKAHLYPYEAVIILQNNLLLRLPLKNWPDAIFLYKKMYPSLIRRFPNMQICDLRLSGHILVKNAS
ncbi:cell division protein FtsQ [Chlamydiifrater phoenicopteri]|uniref:cell division protein FtsQ n=1 Tax=Chlamydiifrater phoenicopteri TaxID=2681469 RepID=UPI001BCFEF1B|nr:cell division protein FtsQ [Chlamydiifrater phoenicopteri]